MSSSPTRSASALSATMREKVAPATVAILAIPLVVSPVDNAVTWGFNQVRAQPEHYHWTGYWEFMNEGAAGHAEKKAELK